jgi:hypothetical protein
MEWVFVLRARSSDGENPMSETGKLLRCAIYTRKSTEEGLDQEFNTLQAQRGAAEAYIRSQRLSGWQVLPETYDDGGFSGASLERPAMERLLHGIEAGQVDCVLVYKVVSVEPIIFPRPSENEPLSEWAEIGYLLAGAIESATVF